MDETDNHQMEIRRGIRRERGSSYGNGERGKKQEGEEEKRIGRDS